MAQIPQDIQNDIVVNIDPLHLTGVFRLMTASSFAVYKASWVDFVQFAQISAHNPPTEEYFASFLAHKRSGGLSGNTIKSTYSHLNKIFSHLYNKKLGVRGFFFQT